MPAIIAVVSDGTVKEVERTVGAGYQKALMCLSNAKMMELKRQ